MSSTTTLQGDLTMTTPSASATRTFTLASRASKLAMIQTDVVLDALRAAFPETSFRTTYMTTDGDKDWTTPLHQLGKALWTKGLEVALIRKDVDILVHSLKDVPTTLPDGCELGAILEREDPADSLVVKAGLPYQGLADLPDGSVIGTSSLRRSAQLRRSFPKLIFENIRGNLSTRLAKLDAADGPYVALILAKAGLVRCGEAHRITADLTPPLLYHAVGQAALAVEIRSDDVEARALCAALTHWPTEWCCLAERACLKTLEGGCSVPVGVRSTLEQTETGEHAAMLSLTATVTAIDGQIHVEHTITETVQTKEDTEKLGSKLAQILIDKGAGEILENIRRVKAEEIK